MLIHNVYILFHAESLRVGAGAVVEAPLQFHKQCGENIKISSNGQRARKQG